MFAVIFFVGFIICALVLVRFYFFLLFTIISNLFLIFSIKNFGIKLKINY
jgi:hypothetical protein